MPRTAAVTAASAKPTALPAAIDAPRRTVTGRAGGLSYYVGGAGRPLLLIHSINASGSAYEMRSLFEPMVLQRRVYAMDLPGFGFSERSARRYDVRLYVDAILDLLDVIGLESPDGGVDVVALSLSAEFAARAALERVDRVRSLTMITPTGFQRGAQRLRGLEGKTRELPGLHRALSVKWWSQSLYDALSSRTSIRYFLKRTYGSDTVPRDLVDYAYLSSHQPGARHAPLAFLSFRLFSADIRSLYERLALPVWVPHGTRGDFSDFSEAAWTQSLPHWRLQSFDCGAMVHLELPEAFARQLSDFLDPLAERGG